MRPDTYTNCKAGIYADANQHSHNCVDTNPNPHPNPKLNTYAHQNSHAYTNLCTAIITNLYAGYYQIAGLCPMEATTLTSLNSTRAQHSVSRDVLALEEIT